MKHDLSVIIRRVQDQEFPAGTETPVRLLSLWNATMHAWETLRNKYLTDDSWMPDAVRPQFEADIEQFELRMTGYKEAIDAQIAAGQGSTAEGRNALLPTVINGGFLLNPIDPETGKRVDGAHIPDYLTPFTLANQFSEVENFKEENLDAFWEDLRENAVAVPSKIAESTARAAGNIVSSAVSGVSRGLGLPLTVAGIVLTAMMLTRKVRR